MRNISEMIIRLFLQYNHIEKEGYYWINSNNYYKLEKNKKICIYGCLSAIINYG